MCFSAGASFTAGTVLTASGVYSASQVKVRRIRPLSVVPVLFGLQQISEGWVWKSVGNQCVIHATNTYLLFAFALWPLYIPLAVYVLETQPIRKRLLIYVFGLGLVTCSYAIWYIFAHPLTAHPMAHAMGYFASAPYTALFPLGYLIAVLGGLLLSSRSLVNLVGVGAAVAWVTASYFYTYSFLSTWCFFCALLSILIIVETKREGSDTGEMKVANTDISTITSN